MIFPSWSIPVYFPKNASLAEVIITGDLYEHNGAGEEAGRRREAPRTRAVLPPAPRCGTEPQPATAALEPADELGAGDERSGRA